MIAAEVRRSQGKTSAGTEIRIAHGSIHLGLGVLLTASTLLAAGPGDTTTVTVTETASAQTDAVGIPKPQKSSTAEPGAVGAGDDHDCVPDRPDPLLPAGVG